MDQLTKLSPEGWAGDTPEQGAVGVDQETGEELLYESAVGGHKVHTVHTITAHRTSSSQHSLRRGGSQGQKCPGDCNTATEFIL